MNKSARGRRTIRMKCGCVADSGSLAFLASEERLTPAGKSRTLRR
jgi:hypothetical protein